MRIPDVDSGYPKSVFPTEWEEPRHREEFRDVIWGCVQIKYGSHSMWVSVSFVPLRTARKWRYPQKSQVTHSVWIGGPPKLQPTKRKDLRSDVDLKSSPALLAESSNTCEAALANEKDQLLQLRCWSAFLFRGSGHFSRAFPRVP